MEILDGLWCSPTLLVRHRTHQSIHSQDWKDSSVVLWRINGSYLFIRVESRKHFEGILQRHKPKRPAPMNIEISAFLLDDEGEKKKGFTNMETSKFKWSSYVDKNVMSLHQENNSSWQVLCKVKGKVRHGSQWNKTRILDCRVAEYQNQFYWSMEGYKQNERWIELMRNGVSLRADGLHTCTNFGGSTSYPPTCKQKVPHWFFCKVRQS